MSGLELRFSTIDSAWTAALLVIAAAVVSVLVYWRSLRNGASWVVFALVALRFAALSVALILLLRPILRYDVTERREERLIVLLDRSRSMSIADSVGGEARIDSAQRVLESEALASLAKTFHVELRAFAGPREIEALPAAELIATRRESGGDAAGRTGARVVADGSSTDLAAAWSDLTTAGGPIVAVLLLTDGRDHGSMSGGMESTRRADVRLPPAPIWAVGLGSGDPEPVDLAWTKASAERSVLKGSRVRVRAAVTARGVEAAATDVVVKLGSAEIERRRVELARGTNEIDLAIVPQRAGRLIYELQIDPHPGESSTENNRTWLVLDVTDRPIQVLFFEGGARWQYKFARRGMARDPAVNVTGLVTLSGDRLLQQGRAPVDLEMGLPTTREDWKAFDVLVLGNVVADDLSPDAARRIVAWLGTDGGGLILPGGVDSQRALRSSPLGEVLPVAPGDGSRIEGPLRIMPAAASLEHPILRGLMRFFAAASKGGSSELDEVFRVGELRPGAELLLTSARPRDDADNDANGDDGRRDGGGEAPLLATRQYGEGRVVAWLTESDWRWVMQAGGEGESARLFELLWGRMVRWAARRAVSQATDGSLELSRREVRAGEEVVVEVGADAATSIAVRAIDPAGSASRIAGVIEDGRWVGRFRPTRSGVHRLVLDASATTSEASGVDAASVDAPSGETVLIVHPDAREDEDTRPDWDLLRDLAAESGGRFLSLAEAGSLADAIRRDHPGLVTHVELGTERSWWLWALFVALVGAEWGLRRRVWVV